MVVRLLLLLFTFVGKPWIRKVTYTTVGTVGSSALLGGLVDLDVLDDQVAGVKTLGVGVGLSVLEEREKELSALHGPAGLGDTESLAYVVVSLMLGKK